MARPPSITYDDFKASADTLSAHGRELTFQALREQLGTISHAVLKRYLETYKAQNAAGMASVPTGVFSGAQALYEQAKTEARRELRAQMDEQLAQAQAQLQENAQKLEIERSELLAKANSEQGRASVLQDQVTAMSRELASLREQHQDLQRQHEQLRTSEEIAQAQVRDTQLQLEKLSQQSLQALQAHQSERQQDQHQAAVAAQALREQLQQASDQYASSLRDAQRHFLLELDKLRQQYAEQMATKVAQLASAQESWAAARQDGAQWKNRVTELEQQVQMQIKSFALIEMLVNAMGQVKDKLDDLHGPMLVQDVARQWGAPVATDARGVRDMREAQALRHAPQAPAPQAPAPQAHAPQADDQQPHDLVEPRELRRDTDKLSKAAKPQQPKSKDNCIQGKPTKRGPSAASSKNTPSGPTGPRGPRGPTGPTGPR